MKSANSLRLILNSIKFFGLIFSGDGESPDPEKVSALKACEPPANKNELRSFLGMTNGMPVYQKLFTTDVSIAAVIAE